ncbi:MAG: 4'-phosphopantetheinyl transferase superfamily protein [Dongiaceae bacterium]
MGWERPLRPPALAAAAHVWRADLDGLATDVALLDDAERARAARFAFETDRRRFIAEHGFQRRLLAAYLDKPAAELAIAPDLYGKPRLARAGIAFNGSESGGTALVAVARTGEIGVDLEALRPERADLRIARRYFHPEEVRKLESLPLALQPAAFFAVWTRKEALVKAVGLGLRIPLASFVVGALPEEAPGPLRYEADWPGARDWRLVPLPLEPGHVGTLAVAGALPDPRLFEWAANDA